MYSTIDFFFPFHMKSVKGEEGKFIFWSSLASPVMSYSVQDFVSVKLLDKKG